MTKYRCLVRWLGEKLAWVGAAAAFLGIIVATCVDVLGSKIFHVPLPGSYEIISYAQLIAIACAVSLTLFAGEHVEVDLFVSRVSKRTQGLIDAIISIFGLGLFVMITWQAFEYAQSLRIAGEVSGTIKLPLFLFSYVLAVASISVCLAFILRILEAAGKVLNR
ncbi:MAG: TRAP transporter small permease [Dehalococcoidia bacterium]